MLSHFRLRNFKAWADTGEMHMAPLTILFGGNSSGKSSLGHLLMALKQTALLSDRRRSLHLGDENSLVDLGTYTDCVHGHDLANPLGIELGWNLPAPLTIRNARALSEVYKGRQLTLTAELGASSMGQPETREFAYTLSNHGAEQLRAVHGRGDNKPYLECSPLKLVRAEGRGWPLDAPEKFYRFSDRTLSRYQNADFLAEFVLETERLLENFFHLGPLRSPPERLYSWSGDSPQDVGALGEFTIPAILAATQQGRMLNRGHNKKKQRFDVFIAEWLKRLEIIHSFAVRPIAKGRKEYEVLIRAQRNAPEVKLTDVGFGVSQVLPALVQAFYTPPGSVLWMEQPEIHLHPRVQSNLADAFISATQAGEGGRKRDTQLIIESHSEHFLNRLQRRVAEQTLHPDDVAIYFVTNHQGSARLEPLALNEFGDIENWPDEFFGDEMEDISQRALAAARRKKQQA